MEAHLELGTKLFSAAQLALRCHPGLGTSLSPVRRGEAELFAAEEARSMILAALQECKQQQCRE